MTTSTPASTTLIDAHTLMARIDDPALRIFDCRFSLAEVSHGRHAYAEGHLPGAHYAHLDERLSSPITPESGRHPLPDPRALAAWLGECGVTGRSEVVVYDDTGGTFAVRLWWLLRWLGHDRVSVLDGGFQAWTEAGGELSTEVPRPVAADFPVRLRNAAWISTRDLARELEAGTVVLIDARAGERFRGEVEPLDAVAGHIPGSINRPLTDNLDASGRFLPAAALRERFLTVMGEAPPERVVHGCGSGVTACHNLLAMEVAGLCGSRLYAGSWSEWIRSPERPVATGP